MFFGELVKPAVAPRGVDQFRAHQQAGLGIALLIDKNVVIAQCCEDIQPFGLVEVKFQVDLQLPRRCCVE